MILTAAAAFLLAGGPEEAAAGSGGQGEQATFDTGSADAELGWNGRFIVRTEDGRRYTLGGVRAAERHPQPGDGIDPRKNAQHPALRTLKTWINTRNEVITCRKQRHGEEPLHECYNGWAVLNQVLTYRTDVELVEGELPQDVYERYSRIQAYLRRGRRGCREERAGCTKRRHRRRAAKTGTAAEHGEGAAAELAGGPEARNGRRADRAGGLAAGTDGKGRGVRLRTVPGIRRAGRHRMQEHRTPWCRFAVTEDDKWVAVAAGGYGEPRLQVLTRRNQEKGETADERPWLIWETGRVSGRGGRGSGRKRGAENGGDGVRTANRAEVEFETSSEVMRLAADLIDEAGWKQNSALSHEGDGTDPQKAYEAADPAGYTAGGAIIRTAARAQRRASPHVLNAYRRLAAYIRKHEPGIPRRSRTRDRRTSTSPLSWIGTTTRK